MWPTDGWTGGRADGQTDTPSYRDAWLHLKIQAFIWHHQDFTQISFISTFIVKIAILSIFAQFSIIWQPIEHGQFWPRDLQDPRQMVSYTERTFYKLPLVKKLEGGEWWGYVFQTYILMVSARKKSLIALLFCLLALKRPLAGKFFFYEKPF